MSKLLDLWSDLTGVVLDYALSTPPSSAWLMCYGQALTAGDAATARLRAKLLADGSPHGVDGSGNPLVPDARGRATAGKDDMGGVAANRLTAGGAGINGAQLGAAGGAQTHALTAAQNGQHNHGVTDPGHGHGVSDPGHSHATQTTVATDGYGLATNEQVTGAVGYADRAVLTGGSGSPGSAGAGTGIGINGATTGISTQNNGSGSAHNNTQPTLVLNKIIKL